MRAYNRNYESNKYSMEMEIMPYTLVSYGMGNKKCGR